MTEDQIEQRVERMTDCADRLYMAGRVTDEQYRDMLADITAWADREYRAQRFMES
jgi:hypothetical protein